MLLPLDVLKIKMQTNPEALRGRGFFRLLTDEGIGSLYRGWGWTIARNVPGSFAVSTNDLPHLSACLMDVALWRISSDQGIPVQPARLLCSDMGTE